MANGNGLNDGLGWNSPAGGDLDEAGAGRLDAPEVAEPTPSLDGAKVVNGIAQNCGGRALKAVSPYTLDLSPQTILHLLTELAEGKMDLFAQNGLTSAGVQYLFDCIQSFPREEYVVPLQKILDKQLNGAGGRGTGRMETNGRGEGGRFLAQNKNQLRQDVYAAGFKALGSSVSKDPEQKIEGWLAGLLGKYSPLAPEIYDCILKLRPDARILYLGKLARACRKDPRRRRLPIGPYPQNALEKSIDVLYGQIFKDAKDEKEIESRAEVVSNNPDWDKVMADLGNDSRSALFLHRALLDPKQRPWAEGSVLEPILEKLRTIINTGRTESAEKHKTV